jgi:hypothetical protein
MSANACLVYYGLRFEVSRNEIENLETRSDARMVAARKAGLRHFWANFGAPGERHLLFIGAQLAIMGPENKLELAMQSQELLTLMESTKAKLHTAALAGEPSLYLQWKPDV